MNRFRQFWHALNGEIRTKDLKFIRKYLNPQEQIMFYRMPRADQRHGLDVANILLGKIKEAEDKHHQKIPHSRQALSAALLHDVGKLEAPYSLFWRGVYVVAKRVLKNTGWKQLVQWGKKAHAIKCFRIFYVLEYHPQIGDFLLKQIDTDQEIRNMVLEHQKPLDLADSVAMNLLKEADNGLESAPVIKH